MSSIRCGHWTFRNSWSVGSARRIRLGHLPHTVDRPRPAGIPRPRRTPDPGRKNLCHLCQRHLRVHRKHRVVHQLHSLLQRRSSLRLSKHSHPHKRRNPDPPQTPRQEVAPSLRLQSLCQKRTTALGDHEASTLATSARRLFTNRRARACPPLLNQ